MTNSQLIELLEILRSNSVSFFKNNELEIHIDLKAAAQMVGPPGFEPKNVKEFKELVDQKTNELISRIPQEDMPSDEELLFASSLPLEDFELKKDSENPEKS